MWRPCHPFRERAGSGFSREGMVIRGAESPCVEIPGSGSYLRPEKSTVILSPPRMAGFPVAFLMTPWRTGAVGNLLLPY